MRSTASFVVAAALCAAQPAVSQETPEKLVDSLNTLFGKHAGARASHAKGVCVKGTFKPSPDAATPIKAPQFAAETPLLGRFSMGGGNPKAPENTKGIRGLALRLDPDGAPADFVMVNAPVHFAKTPEQMLGFLQARAPASEGTPDAAKVKAFDEANPDTAKQGAYVKARPVPASFGAVTYFAVHAFPVENAKGEKATVKFKAVPAAGELGLTDEEAKAKGTDFLAAELAERLGKGPATFEFKAIVGDAADPVDDVTAEWPAGRREVSLGTVAISAVEPDATCNAFTFDPMNLADGVSQPADPIFPLRSPAYAISLSRRSE